MKLSICISYYNQIDMLKKLFNIWQSYSEDIKKEVCFLIIDDCSKIPINELIDLKNINLNIQIYRVLEDIYCNIGGVRNLAFKVTKTKWNFLTDMDIVIPENVMIELLKLCKIENENNVYKVNRKRPNNTFKIHPALCLITKNKYWEIGGCDEDFCGYYGQTDVHFYYRLNHELKQQPIIKEDLIVVEDNMGSCDIIDRNKDKLLRNQALYKNKIINKNWSTDYCKFKWIEIIITNRNNIV